MSCLRSLKGNSLPDNTLDLEIQKDKKLATFLKEGIASINAFAEKRNKRVENFINRKREIELRRRKEELDIEEKRRKDEIIFERELKIAKFQEEIEMKILNKKLNLNHLDEERIMKDNKSVISLNEEPDDEIENYNNNQNG